MRREVRFIAVLGVSGLLVSLVWLLVSSKIVDGGNPRNLQGLRALTILIEDLDADATSEQITKKVLEDQVLVTLRTKAPRLRYDPAAFPYLYVNLTLVTSEFSYAGNLDLELYRPVDILVGADTLGQQPSSRVRATAAVWDSGVTISGAKGRAADHVRRVLDRLLEEFLADYFRANP